MCQFKPLTVSREHNRVVADHIAAAKGMHTNLTGATLARDSLPTMTEHLRQLLLAHFGKNLRQRHGRPARSILLHPMMHLDDLKVEVRSKNLSGLASKPKKRIHASREVRSHYDWNLFLAVNNSLLIRFGMTGRANDDCLFPFRAKFREFSRGLMETEIDDYIAAIDYRRERIAHIDLPGNFDVGNPRCALREGLAHSALCARDDDSGHERRSMSKRRTPAKYF